MRRAQQAESAALPIESRLDVAKNTQVGILIIPMSMARVARRSKHSTHVDNRDGRTQPRLTAQMPFRSIRLLHP